MASFTLILKVVWHKLKPSITMANFNQLNWAATARRMHMKLPHLLHESLTLTQCSQRYMDQTSQIRDAAVGNLVYYGK